MVTGLLRRAPRAIRRAGRAIKSKPWAAGGAGILTGATFDSGFPVIGNDGGGNPGGQRQWLILALLAGLAVLLADKLGGN